MSCMNIAWAIRALAQGSPADKRALSPVSYDDRRQSCMLKHGITCSCLRVTGVALQRQNGVMDGMALFPL